MYAFNLIKRSGWRGAAAVVAVSVVLPLCGAQAAGRTTEAEAQARAAWREAIVQTPTPAGCFNAEYPSTSWKAVACTVAPKRPYLPARGHARYTVGDGNDFAAVTTGLISSTTGTFPKIKGLTSENDGGTANSYSLQINSQFFNSPTCKGASNPANCLGWEQFVYSSDSRAAFMQYWLIRYNNTCPSGWFTNSNDCYKNSAAVNVPLQAISQLGNLKLVGAAGATTDKLTMTTDTKAYKTSGPDSVVGLAAFWNGSEFNIIGDGDGSRATFNTGTSLTVKVALATGGTDAPTCKGNSGTTAETNNLNLGKCTAKGGKKPFINFVESN